MSSSGAQVKYNAIIVNPDAQARSRLRQAASAVTEFGKIMQCAELSDALRVINGTGGCDIIFLSYRLGVEATTPFIQEVKKLPNGSDTAFVVVLEEQESGNKKLAMNLLSGADGFLVEPFSVDSLRETTVLAAKIKHERNREREQAAVRLLVKEIIGQIDVVSQLKAAGHEAKISWNNLKDMCSVIQTFPDELKAYYYDTAAELFSQTPPPKQERPIYNGASQRLQRRMEEKLNRERAKKASMG